MPNYVVMVALVATIHDFFFAKPNAVAAKKSWMPVTSTGMTTSWNMN
jgi:hypothetical protein